jgi:hypothetical protein
VRGYGAGVADACVRVADAAGKPKARHHALIHRLGARPVGSAPSSQSPTQLAGFRVQGSMFRVQGVGCRVWGLGLKFRVKGLGFRV